MHRHVVAHGHHFAQAVKDRTGVVPAFLDIGRESRAPQRSAHLFRNGMKDAFEDFQFNRVAHAQSAYHGRDDLSSRSAATKTKNTTAITPFMVKKAALSLLRSRADTSECS